MPRERAPRDRARAAASASASTARPVGVYVVKDGEVSWQPSIDVMRIVLGGQIVAVVALLTLRRLLARR